MTDYATLYPKLKRWAESQGWKVKDDHDNTLLDYAAMNPEAAKAMGYPSKPDVIEMSRGGSDETRYKNLSHELIERRLMKSGMRYWQAHEFATRYEGNWMVTVKKSKPEQIADRLDLTFDGIQSGMGHLPDMFQFTDNKTGTTTYGSSLAAIRFRLSQIHRRYGLAGKQLRRVRKTHGRSTQAQVSVLR